MKKGKQLIALVLTVAMIFSLCIVPAFADVTTDGIQIGNMYYTLGYILGNEETFTDIFGLADPSDVIIRMNDKAASFAAYLAAGGGDFDAFAEENPATPNPSVIVNPDGSETPVEEPGEELEVVSINVINKTEIEVTFSNGEVATFIVDPLVSGTNTRTIIYKEVSYEVKIPYSDVEKPAVEDVVLNNYRQLTVTFNTIVNEESATLPQNYYFELADGLAGKLGASGQITKNNSLVDIETEFEGGISAWWNPLNKNITASREDGKTVVTINLPEDARFDNGLTVIDMVTSGSNLDKELKENVKFNFAVRDVKDVSGKKSIDTAVKILTVKDDVKPTLVKATIDGNEVDLSKTVEVKVDDKIVLEFSEPLEAHNTPGKKVKVYRDGKELDLAVATKAIAIEKDQNTTYDSAKLVTIDLNSTNGFLAGKTPTKGDTFVVLLTGIRDLAGNIIQEAISFNIKVVEDEVTTPPPADKLKILGVEQVLDNVLRIEANKETTTTGAVNVVIKEAAVDKSDVVVDLTTLEFDTIDDKHYAYVAFPAKYKAEPTDTEVDFKGGFYLNKTVIVESAEATKEFDTFTRENMHIEIDRQAPILDTDQINIAYADVASNLELRIGFTDKNPSTWKSDSAVKGVQQKIFTNNAKDYITSVAKGIRVKVEYVNDNGDVVNRYVDIDYAAAAVAGKAHIDGATNELVIDLDTTGLLIDKDGNALANLKGLKSGARFEVSLPKGVASDDYLGEVDVTGLNVQTGTATPATAEFLDESGRANDVGTDEHGYTSIAANVTIIIGEDTTTTPGTENKVPQTSKKLIAYDRDTDELVILVTGLPTRESVENLDNYVLNGKTLKDRGVTKAHVLFADAEPRDITTVETALDISGQLDDVDKYKVIRIELPEGSIKKDGPADLTVRGLKHKEGGMMAEVSVVVEGLKDNTAPEYVSGKIEGSNKLLLKFDEPVVLVEDALPTSAIRNFKVKINGELVSVLSVNASDNVLEIEIANDNTVIDKAEIEIIMNNNGKMEIADEAGNELKVTETPIVIVK